MPSILEVPFRPLRLEPSLKEGLSSNVPGAALWSAEVAIVLNKEDKSEFTLIAKIDTGAPLSLLPGDVLPFLNPNKTFKHDLYGVVKDPACRVPVTIGVLDFSLRDPQGTKISFEEVPIAVSHRADTPILLGIAGILDVARLEFRKEERKLVISWPHSL